ncbi:MAG: hypothetical protein HY329_12420 [Chloroflexi bacterium]|nr:hypothetical protein [Chloroflexota bacterium]
MHSSLIGKIEKAKRYARERDRVLFTDLTVSFRGENDQHTVAYREGRWTCSCEFFRGWDTCCHTMAMQQILADMLPAEIASSVEEKPLAAV